MERHRQGVGTGALAAFLLTASPAILSEELLAIDALGDTQLEQESGRQGVPFQWQINDNEQSAVVSDNILSGQVITGDNLITDNAFGNMQGIATVIQNSGNQVVIQDTTQINVMINQ